MPPEFFAIRKIWFENVSIWKFEDEQPDLKINQFDDNVNWIKDSKTLIVHRFNFQIFKSAHFQIGFQIFKLNL